MHSKTKEKATEKQMRFRKQTTFNSHDTKFAREDGRLVISNGVKNRCELAINRLLDAGPKGLTANMLATSLNKKFKGSAYSVSDLSYALNRLVEAGLVRILDRTADEYVYRVLPSAQIKWKNLSKIVK